MKPEPMPGARLLFALDPAVAHLNHGAFGAVPIPVQRVQQRLRDEMEANPVRFFADGLVDRIAHTRKHLAGFVGADPDGTALVSNATTAVSVVLNSLRMRPGDEIVLTDHGYGAVAFAVERTCGRYGAVSQTVRLPLNVTDDEAIEAIAAATTPGRTRLVVVDQITSPTARLLPVARIAAAVRDTGAAMLVDAAHVPGMLPVRVDEIGADFWLGNLHKWAYAPRGTALLVVSPRQREQVEPLVVSWQQPAGFPAAVEVQGTADYTAWLAAPAGLHALRSLGVEEVRAHNAALAAYGQRVVGTALGLDAAELPDPGGALSMRVVPLPAGVVTGRDEAIELRRRISAELATEVSITVWGLLRLSAQVYNRAEEYDRLAERLPRLLRQR
jgi:isopenicillin-N epimerase